MANNLYNPSFRTKQIHALNVSPNDMPDVDELYYWLSYEGGKFYSNFRVNGQEDKKFQIVDPVSFSPQQTFENKVKQITFNPDNQILTYTDELMDYNIILDNFLTAESIRIDEETNIMYFSSSNDGVYTVNIPDIYKKHITSGTYNETSKKLVFNYNDSTSMSVDVTSLAKSYSGASTSTITTNVSENVVSSDLKISLVEGNQLQIKSDGLYVAISADLSDYVTQTQLETKVSKIEGKGLSTEDFTTELKSKLENLNYKEGVKINFTSSNSNKVTWSGSVATFTHGLNCYPIVAIYDSNMTQALYGVKILDGNRVSIDFTNKSNVTGTWIMIVNYGASYSN